MLAAQVSSQGRLIEEEAVPMLHNCIIKRTRDAGKVKIENIELKFLIEVKLEK